ncbi:hypothetical protein CYMTET_44108 [Cymbomonas tetramitiformis]|uniref:Phospholipase/carboxylesterase/thioesterase domain-containing protein n=1 Tax=Cymbomonas tetramitiformis TaxID=36881 RepID=A0AAE0EZX3_9CHLO|nr:hypothetical protein CYMTET_44108 [Cymbomonas tetramitiformis]
MSSRDSHKTGVVIWLHGLGDTGAGWSDLEHSIGPRLPHIKWVFPDAPMQPVSCNWGMVMPSWFDLPAIPIDPESPENAPDYQAAVSKVHKIVQKEMKDAGVPSHRVMIGGFSQGGALSTQVALSFPEKLAAGVNFSGWLVAENEIKERMSEANSKTPLMWCHGESDPTVRFSNYKTGIEHLTKIGVSVQGHTFPGMGHSACEEEMKLLREFIREQIPPM